MKEKIALKLLVLFKPFWKKFGFVLFLIFITQALGLLLPYLLARMIDAPNFEVALKFVILSFFIAVLLNSVISVIRDRYEILNLDWDKEIFLNNFSVAKLLGFSIGQHKSQNSGIKQHVVNQGHNSINQMFNEMVFSLMPIVIQTLVTLILITSISWIIGTFVLFMCSLYLFITIYRNIKYKEKIFNWLDTEKEQSKIVSEVYRNIPYVILEAQEKKAKKLIEDAQIKNAEEAKSIWVPYVTETAIYRVLIVIAQYGALAIALYLIARGDFSKGMFVAFLGWIQQSVGNLEILTHRQRWFMILFSRVKKYFELIEKESDIKELDIPIIITDLKGRIEFKNVSYSYSEREDDKKKQKKTSLNKVSFVIDPGEKVGIVGESGAGKSTLVNMLRRAYDPSSGSISIDGINLKNIDLHSYRTNLGNVEQDVAVFDLSLRENLLFGMNGKAKNVTDDDLKKVCKMASIYEFINDQEKGFDTMIGERGIKLSGGERQRVAIARALIKNPKILIFDEATSALDAHNEAIIHESIKQASVGRTTIIIAHRLSTVIDADKIIVMDKGRVVAIGKHDELQETCPEYQKLIKNQVVAI